MCGGAWTWVLTIVYQVSHWPVSLASNPKIGKVFSEPVELDPACAPASLPALSAPVFLLSSESVEQLHHQAYRRLFMDVCVVSFLGAK